ncbi:hypothetical protein RSAG8_09162, partial [Rhizoctonia solani AG-8 WAC10335]
MNAAVGALFFSFLVSQVSAKLALSLDISAPASAVDVAALNVKTTLKNTGDVPLKLFNDPRSILSKAGTNKFNISTGSCKPDFTGSYVIYDLSAAVKSTDTSDFTVLAPNQAIESNHQLASTDLTRCGQGPYEINAFKTFYHVDESGAPKEIEASTNSPRFRIATKGKPATSSRRSSISTLSKRDIGFIGCDTDKKGQIREAATAANNMVAYANSYLAAPKERYKTWFGEYDEMRHNTVVAHFYNIGNKATSVTYDCKVCLDHVVIVVAHFYNIGNKATSVTYDCKDTIDPGYGSGSNSTGTRSMAGVIVRALSHFPENGWTTDYFIGEVEVRDLAARSPDHAVLNAENHRYL